jgi:hypothetical protein
VSREVPIAEAAEVLGLTVDVVRHRLRSGVLSGRKGERGRWLVTVDGDTPAASDTTPTASDVYATRVQVLEGELADVRGQVAALNVDVARLTAERDAHARRADELAAEHDRTWQMLAALTRQNSDLLARIPQLPAPAPTPAEAIASDTAPRSLWDRIRGR